MSTPRTNKRRSPSSARDRAERLLWDARQVMAALKDMGVFTGNVLRKVEELDLEYRKAVRGLERRKPLDRRTAR
jgi:hypothetical protein